MKKVAKWTGLTVVAVVVIVNVVGRGMNAPRYSGPRSDHFDGEAFHNAEPVELPGVWRAVRYALTTTHGAWDVWRENPMATPPPARIGGGGVRVREPLVDVLVTRLAHRLRGGPLERRPSCSSYSSSLVARVV